MFEIAKACIAPLTPLATRAYRRIKFLKELVEHGTWRACVPMVVSIFEHALTS
jgi:hypothetical protein